MTRTNNRPDGTRFSRRWFNKSQTKLTRPRQITGFFNDGGGKQNPPGEMLVAPPKNRFLFSKPWGTLLLHQGKPKEKGGKALSFPGTENNAIKSVGFYATMAGQSRVPVLPGRQKIVKKLNFLKTSRCALVLLPEIYKKANFLKKTRGISPESTSDVLHIIDGGGKNCDISEEYYGTQRFFPQLRATVLCTNEWRHNHQVKHGLFTQVLHKVVPARIPRLSKVPLEPLQSIKQLVSTQCIHLTLKYDIGSIGW